MEEISNNIFTVLVYKGKKKKTACKTKKSLLKRVCLKEHTQSLADFASN